MPQSVPPRAFSQKELPPSVETAYYRKCIELRRRINDIEENNDGTRLRLKRLNRGIQKMRLERVFLLEQLHKLMEYNADDSDRSSSPPPTPTDKPMRSKRSHRRGTPPAGDSQLGSGMPGGPNASPGSTHHAQILHSMNPMSSAQSTPDPSGAHPFFNIPGCSPLSTINGTGGTSQPVLPPLHALPPLQSLTPRPLESGSRAYFDPAHDEQRMSEREREHEHEGEEYTGRRRAHSGAQVPQSEARDAQNGDTEMTDAAEGGFTAVNR
ncbi:hypothetical protein BDV95DRAFT_564736 [Massariosphaeria phaeospora]|uniref:INO80 complex subunit F domain-containing protein n=1 Tax=Massariosphaeria phaeospora TaxID=100035 RepID=A0A7C8IBF5_9PLEO|nr:hypothetical protein BDV95DRAFT_564736 [Massariosphaeria phaeospora]